LKKVAKKVAAKLGGSGGGGGGGKKKKSRECKYGGEWGACNDKKTGKPARRKSSLKPWIIS
jgi:hypothetical protein